MEVCSKFCYLDSFHSKTYLISRTGALGYLDESYCHFYHNVCIFLYLSHRLWGIIFVNRGAVAHSSPNFIAAKQSNGQDMGAVITAARVSGTPFSQQLVGVMQMVYSVGLSSPFLGN